MNPAWLAFLASGGEAILRGLILHNLPTGYRLTIEGAATLARQLVPTIQERLRGKGYRDVARTPAVLREVLTTVIQAQAQGRLIQGRRDGDRVDDPRSTFPGSPPDTDTRSYTVRVRVDDTDGSRAEVIVTVTAQRGLSRNDIFQAAMVAAEDRIRRGQVTLLGGAGREPTVDMRILTAYRGDTLTP